MLTKHSYDLITLAVVVALFQFQLFNVFAASPSFRDTLEDEGVSDSDSDKNVPINRSEFNNLPIGIDEDTDSVDKFKSTDEFRNLPIDILSVSSVSNGEILNGTIWLSTPIYNEQHLEYENSKLKFTMMIYFNDEDAPSYFIDVVPKRDGTWTKIIQEDEPYSAVSNVLGYKNKTVSVVHNYTGFFENGNRYVDISLNLGDIGYPDKYEIGYKTHANINGTELEDRPSSLTTVPILQNEIVRHWPNIINPIQLRQGDTISLDIPINSTELYVDGLEEYMDGNDTDGITIDFDPSHVYIPLDGQTNVKMIIKTTENVSVGHHIIPILTNGISMQGSPYQQNETMNIDIMPHLRPLENVSNSVQANSTISASVPLVITSMVGIGLTRYIHKPFPKILDLNVGKVLEIDAAVIVGVLIFLTIGSTGLSAFTGLTSNNNNDGLSSGQNHLGDNKDNINLTVGLLTASIVYPFAISAIRVITTGSAEKGVRFMTIGFIYLMASIVIITFLNQ